MDEWEINSRSIGGEVIAECGSVGFVAAAV
jgi:hypothetical protein